MMLHDTFLLQQMVELTDALHQRSGKGRARTAGHCIEPWSDEERRRIFHEIGTRRADGESFGCIAHALNVLGIRGEHGGRWYGATVRNFTLRHAVSTTTQ
jgi:hypothetical protein